MAKIAIMGFGTVGSGVLEVCRRNAASIARRAGEPVEVKYILDVRDFSSSPDATLFTNSIDTILADPEVKVVVETIGGTRFAYPYVRQCLESGRSVCTSNKEMVAPYGAELLALATEHHVAVRVEARVGGGKLLVLAVDTKKKMDQRPATRQLLESIDRYVRSDRFAPEVTLDESFITSFMR